MEKNRNAIGDFTEELKSYAEIKSEDLKLAAIEKTALLSAFLSSSLIVFLILSLFLVTGSLALFFWIGKLVNNYALGMGIVCSFFFILLLVYLAFFKKSFRKYFANKIVSMLAN
jgi:ABC-type multidrug transport system fused ATPase/permease subunit